MNVDWDDIGFVISSRYRIEVLQQLAENPSTPSQIAADRGLAVAHVSRALQQLRDRSMVSLLVPEDRKKGRVYGITKKGSAVWNRTEKDNLA